MSTIIKIKHNKKSYLAKESYYTVRNRCANNNMFIEITTYGKKKTINKSVIEEFEPAELQEKNPEKKETKKDKKL